MKKPEPIFSEFYRDEGLPQEPKQYFVQVADLIEKATLEKPTELLDVGCANGWFIHYLHQRFSKFNYTGIDIFDEFFTDARRFTPEATFVKQSMLDHTGSNLKQYDIVTALAVMQILDDTEVTDFFDFLFNSVKPGGRIYLFAPFNEHGIDVILKYRHHMKRDASKWFPGGNAYSFETLEELISNKCQKYRIIPFNIGMHLPASEDPRRGWTIKTEKTDFQMINGLKLLMDQYIVEIKT
jgi:cyclopropane fatty-acyl-phospholipid synthase-like methyltransferase